MAMSPPAPLADADKLNALRTLDQFREWRSLDDKASALFVAGLLPAAKSR